MTGIRGVLTGFMALTAAGAAPAAELPQDIRAAGAFRLTVNATYAPMEYRNPATNELTGLDIDLATEIAKRLGVRIVWSETPFAELIPSLQTGRADFIISGITDRISRRDNADFVDYVRTGAQFAVLAGSPAKVETDLCGKKVGTTRSTSFPVDIAAWSKKNCEEAGKPAIQYVPAENSIDARNQMKQERVDAVVQGAETLPYALQNEAGKYRIIGKPFTVGYQGIMFRKDATALREVVTETLRGMMSDGTYGKILDKYELGVIGIDAPLLNAGTQ